MPFINSDEPTREVFQYNNGVKTVFADPAVVWRKLEASSSDLGENWGALAQKWRELGPDKNDTSEVQVSKLADFMVLEGTLCAVARQAFNLKPLDDDGNGATEQFVMAVLCDFVGDRKENVASPEAPQPTSDLTEGATDVPLKRQGMPTVSGLASV